MKLELILEFWVRVFLICWEQRVGFWNLYGQVLMWVWTRHRGFRIIVKLYFMVVRLFRKYEMI